MTHLRLSGALALLLATACGSSKPATTDTAPQPEPAAEAAATEDAVADGASEAAKTSPPEDPKEKPSETKPAEAPKEDNALVLELAIRGKDLDDAGKSAMEKEAREIIQKSAKLALSDKGIKAPRHVIATITADPLAGDKKGFSVKLGMTGVTKNGSCPSSISTRSSRWRAARRTTRPTSPSSARQPSPRCSPSSSRSRRRSSPTRTARRTSRRDVTTQSVVRHAGTEGDAEGPSW